MHFTHASEILERAHDAIGLRTIYQLGKGPATPDAPTPGPTCDCSAFVAWCHGLPKDLAGVPHYAPDGDWFNTDMIHADANDAFGFVARVPWALARPGMMVVYPGHHDAGGVWHYGHVGIVSAMDATAPLRAIHCSMGNYRDAHDAIQETSAALFIRAGAIAARVAWVTYE